MSLRIGSSSFSAAPSGGLLSVGSQGPAVADLQNQLQAAGFDCGGADGIFGPMTEAAVRSFQQARGLEVDGIAGPQTMGALGGGAPAAPAPAPASPAGTPMLSQGSQGPAVAQMQQLLAQAGFDAGGADGDFGPHTLAAVQAFQSAHGLEVDGICGPQTWGALQGGSFTPAPAPAPSGGPQTLQQGATGPAVSRLQLLLQDNGFNPGGIDGVFGPQTRSAVIGYQSSRGLSVDGVVGPQTWNALNTNAPGVPGGGPGWNPGAPGKLYGADTSSWQSDGDFQSTVNGAQFSMIKASEGTGWTDPTFGARWAELGQKIDNGEMKLRVAYQFMHPGDGVGQAQHFLDVVGIHGPMPAGTRLCLDWEADALNDPQALADAANYIHGVTGVWPLIYTSGSQVPRAQAAAPEAPIWEAVWGSNVPSDVPFVQYSDGPVWDHDVFNGDLAALEHFAGWN